MSNTTLQGREKGVFGFPANFEVSKAAPLDARQVCETKEQKYELEYTYDGMLAVVTADPDPNENGLWICVNKGAPEPANPGDLLTGAADWEKAGGGSGAGNPVKAFKYFTTQEQITTAVENNEPEAGVTTNAIDLSTEGVDNSTPGQILIESSVNQEDYSDEFNGNYILDQNGDLILCSAEPMDPSTYVTTVTFDGEIDPATDFTTPFTVTSSTLELNDLVIILDDDTVFKVNIQSGGGQRTYQPHDFDIPVDTPVLAGGIGGIKANETSTSLTGLEYDEMWNKLLFPAVAADPSPPTASVNIDDALLEVGFVWVGEIEVGHSLGSIGTPWPGSAFKPQGPRSDGMIDATLTLFDGSTVDVFNSPTSLNNYNFTQGYEIKKGANDPVSIEINFLSGPQPVDNTGADSGSAYPGGDATDSVSPFTGAWPVYLGLPTGNNDYEKTTIATENTTPKTGGTTSNKLQAGPFNNTSNTFEFSQDYGDTEGGVRHRVAIHTDYVGQDGTFDIQERNFQTGGWGASDWVSGGTMTVNVNPQKSAETYVIMKKNGSSSGGDKPNAAENDAKRVKYRIISA